MLLDGRMSFSKPNDPLLTFSLPFIVEDHPAHSCSLVPGYIIDFSLGRKLAVFQSNTSTAVPNCGPPSGFIQALTTHTHTHTHTHRYHSQDA